MMNPKILNGILVPLLVACQGMQGGVSPSEHVSESLTPEMAETVDNNPARPATYSDLAEQLNTQHASESRDSMWAARTESIVNELVQESEGTVESPIVCKTTLCRGTFSFQRPFAQETLMGLELLVRLGLTENYRRLALPGSDSSSVVFYLQKNPPPSERPVSPNRPPPYSAKP